MAKKLIITADDYGMCDSVNRAIEECIAKKVVLSTNVMTNMECAADAATLREKYPYVSIGIHYNFTVGKPITPSDKVRSLIGKDGYFLSYPEIRAKLKEGSYNFSEVRLEMEAQYKRYVEILGEPDYWNTHENVHVYPKIYQLFRDVSLEFGITKMRSHERVFIPASTGKTDKSLRWIILEPLKQLMLDSWQKKSRKLGVSAPGGILVRMCEDDKLNIGYLFNNIKWGKRDVAEMAIHPSVDGDNEYFGEITDLRVKEYECFSSSEVLEYADKAGIEIVGFEVV